LATPSKQHSVPVPSDSGDSELNTETDVIHEDESGIKVEVVSVDNSPVNILIHIPDGRVIDLTCEY
jgi:hypothetical protein